jgi:hypothetical protein
MERAMGIEQNTRWILNDFARFPESAKSPSFSAQNDLAVLETPSPPSAASRLS